jgi:hypothetical protein
LKKPWQQRACEIQLASGAGRGPNLPIPKAILRMVPQTRMASKINTQSMIFETMLWRAGIAHTTHSCPRR